MAQTYSHTVTGAPAQSRSDAPVHPAITRPLFMLGRAIFGGYFLYSGIQHFLNTPQMAGYAASKGVPWPELAVVGSGALLVLGSISILLGVLPRIGAAMIALFLIGVTPTMHAFWRETGPAAQMDLMQFMKNLGLLGAALFIAAVPGPWPARVIHRHPEVRHGRV
jgi:uncharacterized membrane protein YphA (DoxX/SURF4 family)